MKLKTPNDFSNCKTDYIAEKVLSRCGTNNLKALEVLGDGNCLFNSLSVIVCGNESRSFELRLRCALELILHKEYYTNYYSNNFFHMVSLSYEEACKNAVKNGSFSSVWLLHAAAGVLQQPIHSVYPNINGILDKTALILNHILLPKKGLQKKKIYLYNVVLMW